MKIEGVELTYWLEGGKNFSLDLSNVQIRAITKLLKISADFSEDGKTLNVYQLEDEALEKIVDRLHLATHPLPPMHPHEKGDL